MKPWRSLALALLLLMGIWVVGALLVENPKLLPGPVYVLRESLPSFGRFSGTNQAGFANATVVLAVATRNTLVVAAVGLAGGLLGAIPVGLALHWAASHPMLRSWGVTLEAALRATPLFAMIPLFVFWFGNRWVGSFIYVTFAVTVVGAVGVQEALRNVPRSLVELADSFGASRRKKVVSILLPGVLNEMRGTVRVAAGLTWAFALGAEFIGTSAGLGYLVRQSYQASDMGRLVVLAGLYGAITLVTVGFTLWATSPGRWLEVRNAIRRRIGR